MRIPRGPITGLVLGLCVLVCRSAAGQTRGFEEGPTLNKAPEVSEQPAPKADTTSRIYLERALKALQQNDCVTALPDLEAFVHSTPAKERQGSVWDDALLRLATCRRAMKAIVELKPELDSQCHVDQGPLLPAPRSGVTLEVEPGEHVIECTTADQIFQTRLRFEAQTRQTMEAHFVPKAESQRLKSTEGESAAKAEVDLKAQASEMAAKAAGQDAPLPPEPSRQVEFSIGGGFGPSRGGGGLSLGLRIWRIGVEVGSGFFPVGASAIFFFTPGETGPYVSAGYVRLAPDFMGGGSKELGHEAFGILGMDIRPLPHLGIRLGLGAAYLSTENNAGPLTFDAAAFWYP